MEHISPDDLAREYLPRALAFGRGHAVRSGFRDTSEFESAAALGLAHAIRVHNQDRYSEFWPFARTCIVCQFMNVHQYWRTQKRQRRRLEPLVESHEVVATPEPDHLVYGDLLSRIDPVNAATADAIWRLGYSQEEYGRQIGICRKTIMKRYQKAVMRLRYQLADR